MRRISAIREKGEAKARKKPAKQKEAVKKPTRVRGRPERPVKDGAVAPEDKGHMLPGQDGHYRYK